jgi:hypothetical protein
MALAKRDTPAWTGWHRSSRPGSALPGRVLGRLLGPVERARGGQWRQHRFGNRASSGGPAEERCLSPTARSLAWLRARGFTAIRVEHFDARLSIRRDLWGADVLAVSPAEGVFLLVQVTTIDNMASRIRKLQGIPEIRAWLATGGRVHVHGWLKRDGRWEPKCTALSAADLSPEVIRRVPRRARRPVQRELFA